jgi:hypothetical protein
MEQQGGPRFGPVVEDRAEYHQMIPGGEDLVTVADKHGNGSGQDRQIVRTRADREFAEAVGWAGEPARGRLLAVGQDVDREVPRGGEHRAARGFASQAPQDQWRFQ